MAVHEVSYDLRAPGRDYSALYAALRKYTHCHALELSWLIDTSQTAAQVRDALIRHIDLNDRLLVVELSGATAWTKTGLKNNCGKWLQDRFGTA